jgi:hypothetical protein
VIVHWARHPSLELNWLPNSLRKGLQTPAVVFTDADDCGGRYWTRWDYDWGVDGISTRKRPVIEVVDCGVPAAGIIAHEYRHHWQRYSTRKLFATQWTKHGNYRKNIVSYFRASWSEYDALRFQVKTAPDDNSRQWWEWVHSFENATTRQGQESQHG